MKFESGRLTTTQEIMSRMLEALGLPKESDKVFSLWMTSKHLRKFLIGSIKGIIITYICVIKVYADMIIVMPEGMHVLPRTKIFPCLFIVYSMRLYKEVP